MYKVLFALASLVAAASAQPVATSEAAAGCVNGTKTYTINFDSFKANSEKPVPKGYGGLDWQGWSIYAAPGDCKDCLGGGPSHNFTGASNPNIARGDAPSPLTMMASDYGVFRFKSFDLACYDYISDVYVKPHKCSIVVTAADESVGYQNDVESILIDYDESDFNDPKFLTFEGPQSSHNFISFAAVGPPLGKYSLHEDTVINLDNIVVEKKCGNGSN